MHGSLTFDFDIQCRRHGPAVSRLATRTQNIMALAMGQSFALFDGAPPVLIPRGAQGALHTFVGALEPARYAIHARNRGQNEPLAVVLERALEDGARLSMHLDPKTFNVDDVFKRLKIDDIKVTGRFSTDDLWTALHPLQHDSKYGHAACVLWWPATGDALEVIYTSGYAACNPRTGITVLEDNFLLLPDACETLMGRDVTQTPCQALYFKPQLGKDKEEEEEVEDAGNVKPMDTSVVDFLEPEPMDLSQDGALDVLDQETVPPMGDSLAFVDPEPLREAYDPGLEDALALADKQAQEEVVKKKKKKTTTRKKKVEPKVEVKKEPVAKTKAPEANQKAPEADEKAPATKAKAPTKRKRATAKGKASVKKASAKKKTTTTRRSAKGKTSTKK